MNMKVSGAAVIMVVVAMVAVTEATSPLWPQPQDCKYWCKDNNAKLYCCGKAGTTYPSFTREHTGLCPAARSTCTDVRSARPTFCPHDGACTFSSKCCYDACVKHHVCKTAEYY
uniref:Crustin Ha1 n=1 Tax=Hyas araneus TaxID=361634 RepID=B6SFP2_HYAAR|nr:crustin Ha1 [Hyas araneus]